VVGTVYGTVMHTESGEVEMYPQSEEMKAIMTLRQMAFANVKAKMPVNSKWMFRVFGKDMPYEKVGNILILNSFVAGTLDAKSEKLKPLVGPLRSYVARIQKGRVNKAQTEGAVVMLDHVLNLMESMITQGLLEAPSRCSIEGHEGYGTCSGRHRLIVLLLLFGPDVMVPVVPHREQTSYDAAMGAVTIQGDTKRKVEVQEDADAYIRKVVMTAKEQDPRFGEETMERVAGEVLGEGCTLNAKKRAAGKDNLITARILDLPVIGPLKKCYGWSDLGVSKMVGVSGTKSLTPLELTASAKGATSLKGMMGSNVEKLATFEQALQSWDVVVEAYVREVSRLKELLDSLSLDSLRGLTVNTWNGPKSLDSIVTSTRDVDVNGGKKKRGAKGDIKGISLGHHALEMVGWVLGNLLREGKGEEKFLTPPEDLKRWGRKMAYAVMDYISNSGQQNLGRNGTRYFKKVVIEKVVEPELKVRFKGVSKKLLEAEMAKCRKGNQSDSSFGGEDQDFVKFCKAPCHVWWNELEEVRKGKSRKGNMANEEQVNVAA